MDNKQMIKYGKYGWVDLSNLVRRGTRIWWEKSIGRTIEFQYNDIRSTILISGYCDNQKVYIDIDGYVSHYLINTGTILNASLGSVLNAKQYAQFIYDVGDIVNDNLLITNRYRDEKNRKTYEYKCLIDGYCGIRTESDFKRHKNCPVCIGKVVLKGINDVATTHPSLIKYFKDPEDATKYSIGSGQKTWFQCPDCLYEKYDSVCNVFKGEKYSCSNCGDNSSYCNKFTYAFLQQLSNINNFHFDSEKSFTWSRKLNNTKSKKIYDFYLEYDTGVIIEVHGAQHYIEQGFVYCGGRTLKEEQDNDLFKYNLAIENGINPMNYIVIDARKSNKEWIKDSIMNSPLTQIFDFSVTDINWDECHRFACNNLVQQACDLWNSGIHNAAEIGRMIGKAECTVAGYLKKGNEIGWIEYESHKKIPIICLDNGYVFAYSSICSQYSFDIFGEYISRKSLNEHLRGRNKSTHGVHFAYISRQEFYHIKETEPWRIFE